MRRDYYTVEYFNPETEGWERLTDFPHTSKGYHQAKLAALELGRQGFRYRITGTM